MLREMVILLLSSHRFGSFAFSSFEIKFPCYLFTDILDLDRQVKEDMDRLRERQGSPSAMSGARFTRVGSDSASASTSSTSAEPDAATSSPLDNVKDMVDKILIADFFFVLFALAWLGAAVAAKTVLGTSGLLDIWLQLWQWVFQPAIGVLMLGAVSYFSFRTQFVCNARINHCFVNAAVGVWSSWLGL